ncbi:MAG: hypothetical protein ACYC9N_15790 [Thermoanaerobaculia bacterium]
MRVLSLLLPALVAALISFLATPLVRRLALRVGAVDRPGARKVHTVPTPRLGGLAVIFAAASVTALIAWSHSFGAPVPGFAFPPAIGLGLIPIFLISLIDDIRPLPALPKLAVHFLGAGIAVASGIRLGADIHLFGYDVAIGWVAIPLSLLWIAGVTSAFNLVDGLDGLSAGLALISSVSLAAVAIIAGRYELAVAALTLAGAIVGFLPYNIYPAKIFLGDTGATSLGYFLACLALIGGSTLSSGFAILIPILVLGIPITDTLVSMVRRGMRRLGVEDSASGVLQGDRNHFHHRLLALGIDHRKAVLLLYAAGVALSAVALLSLLLSFRDNAFLLITLLFAAVIGIRKLDYDEFAFVRRGAIQRIYEAPVLRHGLFVVFVDLATVAVALYLAFGLKYDDWSLQLHARQLQQLLVIFPAVTLAGFALFKVYRGAWKLVSVEGLARLAAAIVVATVAGTLIARAALPGGPPLSFFVVYILIFSLVTNVARTSYRIVRYWTSRASSEGDPVVIYGAGVCGMAALREMLANKAVNFRPIGFIDDDPALRGKVLNGFPVFGSIESVEPLLGGGRIHGVVVATDKVSAENLDKARLIVWRNGGFLRYFSLTFRESGEWNRPLVVELPEHATKGEAEARSATANGAQAVPKLSS